MLDMGFRPQVEQIVRRLPAQAPDDALLRHARRRGRRARPRVHAQPLALRGRAALAARATATSSTASSRSPPPTSSTGSSSCSRPSAGLALVFVRTKRGADRLAEKLRGRGVEAAAMHGDMTQGARERALERFRSGKVTTLVATDVAARGLDLEAISHVINYDPPEDTKGYVHRVGRTGRAGRAGPGHHARPAGAAGRGQPRREPARPPRAVRETAA